MTVLKNANFSVNICQHSQNTMEKYIIFILQSFTKG